MRIQRTSWFEYVKNVFFASALRILVVASQIYKLHFGLQFVVLHQLHNTSFHNQSLPPPKPTPQRSNQSFNHNIKSLSFLPRKLHLLNTRTIFQDAFLKPKPDLWSNLVAVFSRAWAHCVLHRQQYFSPSNMGRQIRSAYELVLDKLGQRCRGHGIGTMGYPMAG